MNEIYRIFSGKIKLILSTIKDEYDLIISNFEGDNLYEKVFSYLKLDDKDSEYLNEVKGNLTQFMKDIVPEIDNAKITLRPWPDDLNLKKENVIYKSLDVLYALRCVRYNMIMSFIMQLYLIFEKELISFVNLDIPTKKSVHSLFEALNELEKYVNLKFDGDFKKNVNKYRNICNVYKHGDGPSLKYLLENYSCLINNFSISFGVVDGSFSLNLKEVSVLEIYELIIKNICIYN